MVRDLDFEKVRDIIRDDGFELKGGLEYRGSMPSKELFYITTENDPAVGIFGKEVSPTFYTLIELSKWWKIQRKVMIRRYIGD